MRLAYTGATIVVALTLATAIPTTAAAPVPSQPLAPHLLAFSPTPYPEVTPVADYYAEKARKEAERKRRKAERAQQKALREARESRVTHAKTETAQTTRKAGKGALTEAQVRSLLKAAQKHYGVDDWIIGVGLKVMWGESRYNPSARNGQYVGIAQFGASWGSEAKRLDPEWSIYRFVRVYAEGGKPKIRQHWRATV